LQPQACFQADGGSQRLSTHCHRQSQRVRCSTSIVIRQTAQVKGK
jgi:hypothetical protein